MTQTFKRYSAAKTAAKGLPILRVADIYIVGLKSLDEMAIIDAKGQIAGNVTMKHLNRLGNANWAEGKDNRALDKQIDWTGNI